MITRLGKLRYLRIVGFALGGVAVAGAAVVVTASAAGVNFGFRSAAPSAASAETAAFEQSATASNACTAFMKHLAVNIGKSQAEINAAFQKSISDTLADEVKSGQITQAQADAIKKKLAGQTPCTIGGNLTPHGSGKERATIAAYMQQYETAAASALGITPAQLKTDLAAGQSLSQIAAAQKVSEADFRSKLITNLQPALDAAVTNKQLTAAQEQAIVNALKTGKLPLWDKPLPHKPAATATPSAA
jgi:hypothetical protein